MIKHATLLFIFILAGLASCTAQTGLPDKVKEIIQGRIDDGMYPGVVVGVMEKDGPKYYSFGVKSLKTKEPVDEHSVFEIGSITKTFTGILLADKVKKGAMKLDDPLQKYLPKGVTAPTRDGKNITLVNMSNHTSSLPRMPDNFKPANPSNPFADYSEKQMYDFLSGYTLPRDIGSQYEYSNFAVGLLGHVIAVQSGVSYEQLMINVIAKPLGMPDTRITFTPNMKKNLAIGHVEKNEVENWDLTSLAGAGGIRSTAVDMMRYLNANMGLVKTNLYPAMQLTHQNTRAEGAEPKVGLGWHIQVEGDREIIQHNGGTGGYRSFIGFVKGQNIGVVVLTNSSASVDDIGMHLLNPSFPLTPRDTTKIIDVPVATLDRYVGKYEFAPQFILTVSRKENQLSAQLTGQPDFPIFAKAETVFFYKVVEAQLTFNLHNGIAEGVTLNQNGKTLVGKKNRVNELCVICYLLFSRAGTFIKRTS